MGHVDHGKTTLLDFIRKTSVAARESGGITQHIGAYQISYKGKALTFIDTPGHAAFSKMRERGANITDIIILVVALNDGVKPQTIESIRHIKNSKAQVLVAINKADLTGFYPDMVKGQLAEQGIVVSDFGGEVEALEISAKTGLGVDKLLETLVVMADLANLEADDAAPLQAVVIEATKDIRRGSVASVIVREGTLNLRQDIFNDDGVSGRVKSLVDENGKMLNAVGPGCPAEIVGLKEVPAVGSIIKEVGREYEAVVVPEVVAQTSDEMFAGMDFGAAFGEVTKIKVIVKADVEGTLEVIEQNLDKDSVNILAKGVGQVTDTDIELAKTSGAKIIAFKIKIPNHMKEQAKDAGVKIKSYDVIYQLIEDMQKQILKLIEPTIDEVVLGEAEVMQVFEMKGLKIAGCKVKTGELKKTDLFHLKRDGVIIANPQVSSMMHGKEEIDKVKSKSEFALTFKHKKQDFAVGDILVAYEEED